MTKRKIIPKEPPAELLAEYEKACMMVKHFDEAQPGSPTIWHTTKLRLEAALANYQVREELDNGTQD